MPKQLRLCPIWIKILAMIGAFRATRNDVSSFHPWLNMKFPIILVMRDVFVNEINRCTNQGIP